MPFLEEFTKGLIRRGSGRPAVGSRAERDEDRLSGCQAASRRFTCIMFTCNKMFSSLSVRVPGSFGSAHWMIGRVLSVIGLSSLDADITSLARTWRFLPSTNYFFMVKAAKRRSVSSVRNSSLPCFGGPDPSTGVCVPAPPGVFLPGAACISATRFEKRFGLPACHTKLPWERGGSVQDGVAVRHGKVTPSTAAARPSTHSHSLGSIDACLFVCVLGSRQPACQRVSHPVSQPAFSCCSSCW